eukprot:gene16177-17802_t
MDVRVNEVQSKSAAEHRVESNEDANRSNRFVSDKDSCELFKSQSLNNLKPVPYYGGELVTSRMAEVRKSIEYIRANWNDRSEFSRLLAAFLTDKLDNIDNDKVFMKRIDSLKNHQRNWGDIDKTQLQINDFEVIRLYTSEIGYNQIFGALNSLFRNDETTNDPNTIRTIVFLIELINIDLYNYCLKFPEFDNYTGVVYRGVGLQESDFDAFKRLMSLDIPKRYIAIPLGLMSSTAHPEVAKKFIKKEKHAVLFKIHILELKPAFLKYYKERNPTGVVSTICAVSIGGLSDFPEEDEIILRGAFFQVLDFFKDEKEGLNVLEVCMLNSNRDHLSTIHLTDPNARKMFGLMVSVTRNEFAVKYLKNKGNEQEALAYKLLLDKAKEDLSLLMPNEIINSA